MVGEWVYHIAVLFWENCITLNFGWLAISGVAGHLSHFSQNIRDGEQNLLWVINLIYSAHNGRGVLPFTLHIAVLFSAMESKTFLHYIEFCPFLGKLTSYITGVAGHLSHFSQNIRDGEQNLLCVFNLIYSAHNGRGVCLPYCRPFLAKLHYIEFWVTSYIRVAGHLSNFFSKRSRWRAKPFMGN